MVRSAVLAEKEKSKTNKQTKRAFHLVSFRKKKETMTKECEDNKSGHQGESVGGTAASPPFITMMKEGEKKDKKA